MTMKLEARAYGPDSSADEIRAIEERISVYEPGVLMYAEAPVQSEFQLDIFERRMNELGDRGGYRLLIDLTEAKPPGATVRARLQKLFASQPLQAVAIFTGRNFMLNIAAKFVLGGIGLKKFTVHTTQDDALKALRDVR
jgi:hypothetical protein